MFTREFILGMKQKALRRGIWFNALDYVERSILNITSRIVDRVNSVLLGITLVKIMKKLCNALKNEFFKRMDYGKKKARYLAMQAVVWGNRDAMDWISDMGYVNYCALYI